MHTATYAQLQGYSHLNHETLLWSFAYENNSQILMLRGVCWVSIDIYTCRKELYTREKIKLGIFHVIILLKIFTVQPFLNFFSISSQDKKSATVPINIVHDRDTYIMYVPIKMEQWWKWSRLSYILSGVAVAVSLKFSEALLLLFFSHAMTCPSNYGLFVYIWGYNGVVSGIKRSEED